ncbi:polysaccharide deacetylase family protein [Hydrogenobacter hydrogenophilus]|uniref:Polysaccharide deacetylase n=1 Tax=Hydrogenobacter hydrogenophilus TaxID=35835 RepID=A0A285NPW1_9AQUI|nr:polysaccharide deacetylase family protein [Hydrogenobacter hydrogenophilus]SNZ11007.1 Polysaccharide deacetylase [Hydrogenobacter hydrogenophilus]
MILVLVYHKVIKYPTFDLWWKTFDLQCSILKKHFKVITLDQVVEALSSGKLPKEPSVAITFDDGYADNYIYAYPILKKHRLKATLFVASSRIIKESGKRKNLEDYWKGKVSFRELYSPKSMWQANYLFLKEGKEADFLTQEELLSMMDVFEIGWHSKYHTKDFFQEKLIDIFDGKNYHWSVIHAYGEEPVKGFPLFPMKGSLCVLRGKVREEVKTFVKSLDDKFFQRKNWKEELRKELLKNFDSFLEFETQEERTERIRKEIEESIQDLKSITKVDVVHSAYPFGDYDPLLKEELSKRFVSAFTTEKRYITLQEDVHLLPRITVPKDMWSFLAILGKFLGSFLVRSGLRR